MIDSLFYGYLSPQWKRVVRSIWVLHSLFWGLVSIEEEGFELALIVVFILILLPNLFISYIFELFVKNKQENEVPISIFIIFLYALCDLIVFNNF